MPLRGKKFNVFTESVYFHTQQLKQWFSYDKLYLWEIKKSGNHLDMFFKWVLSHFCLLDHLLPSPIWLSLESLEIDPNHHVPWWRAPSIYHGVCQIDNYRRLAIPITFLVLKIKTWTSMMVLYLGSSSTFSFQECLLWLFPKVIFNSNALLWRFQPFCGITRDGFIVIFKLLCLSLSWVISKLPNRILYLQYSFIFLKGALLPNW